MRKLRIAAAGAAALGLVGALTATQFAAADTRPERRIGTAALEDRLAAFAEITGGSALMEVRDGREVWSDAAGDRGLDDARGARPGDLVRIGSVTKSMVAAVVLQLDGEGAIDIDEPIGAYLPGLLPYEEDPTVRQLLQHTSGVPDWVAVAYPGLEAGDLTLGGVQMGCPDDPEEVFLGHVGDGMGHQTQTFHSYDGERQITLSWSIDDKHGYADPAAFGEALSGLLSAGLCG